MAITTFVLSGSIPTVSVSNSCLMLAALKGELNLPVLCSLNKYTSEVREVLYLSKLLYLTW